MYLFLLDMLTLSIVLYRTVRSVHVEASVNKTKLLAVPLSLLSLLLVLAGCQKPQQEQKAAAQAPEVGVVKIELAPVDVSYEMGGRIKAIHKAEIRPQVGGVLQKRLYKEGDYVNQGDALYQIDDALLKAEVTSAKAELRRAQANLKTVAPQAKRYAKLVQVKAVSQQENEQVQGQWVQAQADVEAASAALNRIQTQWEYAVVRAPIDGVIGTSAVTVGSLLSPNQQEALTTIQDIEQVYVDMNQSTSDWFAMSQGIDPEKVDQELDVKLRLENGGDYEHIGKLVFSDVQVDPHSSTVHLRAEFSNPDKRLLPGMYVQARVKSANQDAFLIPQQAVQHDEKGVARVWVITDENKAQLKPVEVWRAKDNQWIVNPQSLEMTNPTIVVEGIQKLQPDLSVRTREVKLDPAQGVN